MCISHHFATPFGFQSLWFLWLFSPDTSDFHHFATLPLSSPLLLFSLFFFIFLLFFLSQSTSPTLRVPFPCSCFSGTCHVLACDSFRATHFLLSAVLWVNKETRRYQNVYSWVSTDTHMMSSDSSISHEPTYTLYFASTHKLLGACFYTNLKPCVLYSKWTMTNVLPPKDDKVFVFVFVFFRIVKHSATLLITWELEFYFIFIVSTVNLICICICCLSKAVSTLVSFHANKSSFD